MATSFSLSPDFSQRIPQSPLRQLGKKFNKSKKAIRENPSTTESIALEPEIRKDVNTRKQYTIATCSSLLKDVTEIHATTSSHDDDRLSHTEVDSVFTSTNADDVSDGEDDDAMPDSPAPPPHMPPPPKTAPLPHGTLKRAPHLEDIAKAAKNLQQSNKAMRIAKGLFTDAVQALEEQFYVAAYEMFDRAIRAIGTLAGHLAPMQCNAMPWHSVHC